MNLRVSDAAVDGEEVMVAVSGRVNEVTATAACSGNDEEFNRGCYQIIIIRNNQ